MAGKEREKKTAHTKKAPASTHVERKKEQSAAAPAGGSGAIEKRRAWLERAAERGMVMLHNRQWKWESERVAAALDAAAAAAALPSTKETRKIKTIYSPRLVCLLQASSQTWSLSLLLDWQLLIEEEKRIAYLLLVYFKKVVFGKMPIDTIVHLLTTASPQNSRAGQTIG